MAAAGYQRMLHNNADALQNLAEATKPISHQEQGLKGLDEERTPPDKRSSWITRKALPKHALSQQTAPTVPLSTQRQGSSTWEQSSSASVVRDSCGDEFVRRLSNHSFGRNLAKINGNSLTQDDSALDCINLVPYPDSELKPNGRARMSSISLDQAVSVMYSDNELLKPRFVEPPLLCSSKGGIYQERTHWLAVTILILSVYSTIMSGIWLVVSFVQPRWGHHISSSGGLLPSTASLITALLAKTIELSFVTVFITCLGQILSRRSLANNSKGVTLAEMTMRNWVFQPGSLITHFETLPSAGLTFLGALCLTATTAAMFYTTASDAMVAPKLKNGHWEQRTFAGYIRASYANSQYMESACPSLLQRDDSSAAESCMNVEFSGQSYHNLLSYMSAWANKAVFEGETAELPHRPTGTTLLYDNTTMTAAWIETENSDVEAHWEHTRRIINNVTMAMPHPGVYKAAVTQHLNDILQPDDLAGVGEYSIHAAVVSPTVNVMCVNADEDDLAPIIYTTWPHARIEKSGFGNQMIGWQGWDGDVPGAFNGKGQEEYLNRTALDDIFRWGPRFQRRPPVFQLYPADYNILTNTSVYMGDAIYFLAKSPHISNYTLCELRSWVTPKCSTYFNISGTAGSHMVAHCEDPDDPDSYNKSFEQTKPPPSAEVSGDWRWLAAQWALSMDLNGGAANANASNARFLSQLALGSPSLDANLPSMAEAVAVYASSSIVLSAIDSPFVHYWSARENVLPLPGTIQRFNGSITSQQYTSGHTNDWQNIFYIVLILVFAINIFCLVYLTVHSGLVTDFSEPQNLFTIAVNSPPSRQLQGSCGAGPIGRDLVVPWRVAHTPSVNHYFFEEASDSPLMGKYSGSAVTSGVQTSAGGGGTSYQRLNRQISWHL